MRSSRIVAAACLIVLILSGALCAHDGPNKILAEKIAELEARIKVLEARISQLEIEISRLSGRPVAPTVPGPNMGANWRELRMGMTKADVRELLGEPDDIPMNSYLEVWDYSRSYGGYCSVTFDENGRVESWNGPQ
ncbi:MAG: outer membrane protein assembly factor BamE [Candidatus Krumholzibacteria bacterium]|nr:outer membrane protein assembly factor BamE [Candidatus Krumholzibacteria bacterium]